MNKILVVLIVMLFSVHCVKAQAQTTWIPIGVGDITTIIPYTPTGLFMAPANINLSSQNGVRTLSWNDVEHASQFEVQGLNAQGQWVTIVVTNALSIILTGNNAAYQSFRVVACSYTSCANTGYWSSTQEVRKKIIFIHTDILGSPVAETDANGVVQ